MPLLNTASAMYVGDVPAQRVYLGDVEVWSAVPPPLPVTIPGLTLWIDAKQQVDSDGAAVSVVKDFSPAKRTITFTGTGPTYRANLHGQPCFEFMAGASGLTCGQWDAGAAGLTFLFVGRVGSGNYPMMVVHGPDADGFEMRHSGRQEIVLRYSSHGIVYTHDEPSGGERDHMWSLRNTVGGASTAWTNRVVKAGASAAAYGSAGTLYVARREGGYPWVGPMREVLVYAGPLSDADMTKLFDYLQPKWGLPV